MSVIVIGLAFPSQIVNIHLWGKGSTVKAQSDHTIICISYGPTPYLVSITMWSSRRRGEMGPIEEFPA